MTHTLVLGGARSGKSFFAQSAAEILAAATGGQLVMIATGQAFDAEMTARIAAHIAARGPSWRTIEAPLDLTGALASLAPTDIAVVDCLTLWLSNLLLAGIDPEAEVTALLESLRGVPNPVWFVSNEVGLGIVPDNALGRRFRDEAGRLHNRLAAVTGGVFMIIAGLPIALKAL